MAPPLRCPSLISSIPCTKHIYRSAQSRSFSSTLQRDRYITRARRALFRWLGTQGANFQSPLAGSTNYLGAYTPQGELKRVVEAVAQKKRGNRDSEEKDPSKEIAPGEKSDEKEIPPERASDLKPFPRNDAFRSQPVLSEELRETIWERIMKEGRSVREVSAQLGVEMSRVGAVIRLKEIEKEWQRIGKPLARPYANAVMSMLPKTEYDPKNPRPKPHESINDLPVHAATGVQIFHPTSESRHFTRADAAKVFAEDLLPADDRVPHPELALMHKDFKAGMSKEQIQARQDAREDAANLKRQQAAERRLKKQADIKKIQTARWEFRFTDVNVDDIGKDGRGHKGVGWRYGVPLMDRSRGQIRIPTRVE